MFPLLLPSPEKQSLRGMAGRFKCHNPCTGIIFLYAQGNALFTLNQRNKHYRHPVNASETSKHAGLRLTFRSSVQCQTGPRHAAHLDVPDAEPSPRPRAPGTFLRPSLAAISSTTSAFGSSRSSKLFCVPICRGIKGRGGFRGVGSEKQPRYSAPFLAQLSPKNTRFPLAEGRVTAAEKAQGTQIKHGASPSGLFPSQAASRCEPGLRETTW